MSRIESAEQYERIGQDAGAWLEKAQGLKHSALILKDHFSALLRTPPNQRRVETNGLFDSILLLLGLAFENLVKGIGIAKSPGIVDQERLDRSLWQADSGHAIAEFARSVAQLETSEENLLKRLQESIVWASRFPIPTTSKRFHDSRNPASKRRFTSQDIETAERLFEKLETILIGARSASPPS